MSEHENELRKALAENGNLDANKARHDAEQASRWFDSRLRWSGRIAWLRIILAVVVFEFAYIQFFGAATTKAMIGYAVVMVITLILVGMITIQSGIAGTKLSLLREIKLLRLECLGRTTEPVVSSALEAVSPIASLRRPLPVWESIAWILALVAVAWGTQRLSAHVPPFNMARFEGTPVTIEAPRIGAPVYVHVYLRMQQGVCHVSRLNPEQHESGSFQMGKGSWHSALSPGESLRLDPQGNPGEYWVRFE